MIYAGRGDLKLRVTCLAVMVLVFARGFYQWRGLMWSTAAVLLIVVTWDKVVLLTKRIRDSIAERRLRQFEEEWESIVKGHSKY
jgi:hypothetical protein